MYSVRFGGALRGKFGIFKNHELPASVWDSYGGKAADIADERPLKRIRWLGRLVKDNRANYRQPKRASTQRRSYSAAGQ